MPAIPLTENEQERLEALRRYRVLDSEREQDFDDLVELAAEVCGTPMALIAMVDEDRQWFKSTKGIDIQQTDKAHSFCAHTIASSEHLLMIENAAEDHRFSHNPFVTGFPNISFYAGVSLVNEDGFALGSLCVIDQVTKTITPTQIKALRTLARQIMDKLELRRKVAELEEVNYELQTLKEKYSREYNRLQLILDTMAEGVSIFDKDGQVVYVNQHTENLFGLSSTAFADRKYNDNKYLNLRADGTILPREEHPMTIVLTEKRPVFDFEISVQQVSKPIFRLLLNTAPLFDPAGNLTGGVCTFIDITHKHQALQQIRESEERFRTMAEGSGLLIALGDTTGNATYFSKAWTDMTGVPMNNLLANGWEEVLHPDDRLSYVGVYTTAFAEKRPFKCQFRVLNKEGQYRWLQSHAQPRFQDDNSFAGYISSCVDITEQKELEQRKDDFISIASHELKTPITSLKASLQLMDKLKGKASDEMFQKLLFQSRKSIQRVSNLVEDLLNVRRLQDGDIRLNETTFILSEAINACCNPVTIAGKLAIELTGDTTLVVYADEHRVEQVITNIVTNAVKYAPHSKVIRINIENTGDMVKASFTDEGPGISQEKATLLFDRYYRVNPSGSHASGLGLGLYISHEIIRRHGGEIGVISELGKGSTFWFTLPAYQADFTS